jgi:hypothetical protein
MKALLVLGLWLCFCHGALSGGGKFAMVMAVIASFTLARELTRIATGTSEGK